MGRRKSIHKWLALVLSLSFLAGGCAGSGQREAGEQPDTETSAAEHIVMTYQTMDYSVTDDLALVEAAINEITVPEIGVEVELREVNALDAFTDYSLWISQGETIDLMIMNYQDITGYIRRGMLQPIEGLLEECAPDLARICEEELDLTQGSVFNGHTYGVIPIQDVMGNGGGIWAPRALVENAEPDYDMHHIYSLEELDAIFAVWKQAYPDAYPLGQITSGRTYSTASSYQQVPSALGTDILYGVLEGGEIVNYFATEEYRRFLAYLQRWYDSGYIYPDAAFTDHSSYDLITSGLVLSMPLSSSPGMGSGMGYEEMLCLRTSVPSYGEQGPKSGFWTIPATSQSPEAAMRFLNLMYADARIGDLLRWGIEGLHYVRLEDGGRRIAYPAGVDMTTVAYYNPFSLYGDYRIIATMDSEALLAEKAAYQEEMVYSDPYAGFVFDDENVREQMAKVQKLAEKYVPVLESGSVDLTVYYPQFLEELSQAGMDDILAEKQRQYDIWSEETGKGGD